MADPTRTYARHRPYHGLQKWSNESPFRLPWRKAARAVDPDLPVGHLPHEGLVLFPQVPREDERPREGGVVVGQVRGEERIPRLVVSDLVQAFGRQASVGAVPR